jgi:long-chain acyl-CoA synthetase
MSPLRLLHDCLLARARDPLVVDKCAVVVEGKPYSYGELFDSASRLATALLERGVMRGDRVAIYMDNSWYAVVSVYACWMAGGVMLLINPQTKRDKLGFILGDAGARILLTDGHISKEFLPLLDGRIPLDAVISSGDFPAGHGIHRLEDAIAGAPPLQTPPATITLDLAALIYTSGSTGQPKGVMQTHQSMLFAASSIIQYLQLDPNDRILCVLPLAFDYGLYQLLMSVQTGATLVLERSFTYPAQVFARMRAWEVTVFPGVPTIFAMLLSAHQREAFCFNSVRRVTNTAAALADTSAERLSGIFPNAKIYKMYGLTECKRVSYLEPDLARERPGSVGKAIPGTEVYLLDADGSPTPAGQTGMLHVRGTHVMLGYWNRPELTDLMLRPGRLPGERVLCTQDQFRMDDDGFLYFVGRIDDIIKTRGEKVSPVEVENAMLAMAGIREVAVIGVADELLGEAIRAYVVLEDGVTLSVGQIRAQCITRLENFMVPQQILLCENLPTTATGKVSKTALRATLDH